MVDFANILKIEISRTVPELALEEMLYHKDTFHQVTICSCSQICLKISLLINILINGQLYFCVFLYFDVNITHMLICWMLEWQFSKANKHLTNFATNNFIDTQHNSINK